MAEIRRGKKKRKKKKPQGKNIMSASATQGGHNKAESGTVHVQMNQAEWLCSDGPF